MEAPSETTRLLQAPMFSAPSGKIMNRRERTVHLVSRYGDSFDMEVNERVTVAQLRQEIQERFGYLPQGLTFSQDGHDIGDDESTIIDQGQAIDFTYHLSGGASISTVTTIPEALRLHCLCWKCGIQQIPDLEHGDWFQNTFLCLHEECGPKDCLNQQVLCIKVPCKPFGVKIEKKMPQLLNVHILCFKCGVKDFPDIARDDWMTGYCCCVYQNCGPKDLLRPQILCIKASL